MRSLRAVAPALVVGAALAAAGLPAAGCGGTTQHTASSAGEEFLGAAVPGAPPAPGFALRDLEGRPVSLTAYRGAVVVLTFLSSNCGPTCILISEQIRGALDQVAHPPPVLVVSVDERADTPARVRAFLGSVSLTGRARWLTGSQAALMAVWRAYRVTPPAHGWAGFARTAPVVLIDREGRERVLYETEQLTPEALAHDIGALQTG